MHKAAKVAEVRNPWADDRGLGGPGFLLRQRAADARALLVRARQRDADAVQERRLGGGYNLRRQLVEVVANDECRDLVCKPIHSVFLFK